MKDAIFHTLAKGEQVRHGTEADKIAEAIKKWYVCAECGGLLGSPLLMINGQTHVSIRCFKNPNHRGIFRPRPSPRPYGMGRA